jgi:glycosyltransferase involved in cell wall biosynthesis
MNSISLLVSVIIPCFNAEKYLMETVESVIAQTYTHWEIIIVDDFSTDDTFKLAQDLSQREDRINCFRIEHSGLPSVVRNFGSTKAEGEYLAFLDSDDLWARNKLEEQIKYLNQNKTCLMVYSMSLSFGDVNFFSPRFELLPLLHKACRSYDDLIEKGNSITCSSVIVKKDLFNAANGFDENPDLKAVEDYELWIRLSRQTQIGFIPKILVRYRIHKYQSSDNFEVNNQRLKKLASIKNLDIKLNEFRRNISFIHLILRNSFHAATILYVKLRSWIR